MTFEIRGVNLELQPSARERIERRLSTAFGRLARRIRSVTLSISDLNGPKGGVDKRCLVEVELVYSGRIVADGSDDGIAPAVDRATARAARQVRETLDKERSFARVKPHTPLSEFGTL